VFGLTAAKIVKGTFRLEYFGDVRVKCKISGLYRGEIYGAGRTGTGIPLK
jgi:hypothetical protein